MRANVLTSAVADGDAVSPNILGLLSFAPANMPLPVHPLLPGAGGRPCLQVPMQSLDGQVAVETWQGGGDCICGERGAVHYCLDGDRVFGTLALHESAYVQTAAQGQPPLQRAAEAAYRAIFSLLDELGFPELYRFWNYMPDINGVDHGLERYRQFNLGRQQAFDACGRSRPGSFPAACALGSAAGPLNVAFLAGRAVPLRVENPRQVSAYHYPTQYGPRPPLFSRATLVPARDYDLLLISGTASIIGHATQHAGDIAAQTRETLINIQAVLEEANRLRHQASPPASRASLVPITFGDLALRVYVRRPADLPVIRQAIEQAAEGGLPQAAYLQADVCRPELLVEIEARATAARHGT